MVIISQLLELLFSWGRATLPHQCGTLNHRLQYSLCYLFDQFPVLLKQHSSFLTSFAQHLICQEFPTHSINDFMTHEHILLFLTPFFAMPIPYHAPSIDDLSFYPSNETNKHIVIAHGSFTREIVCFPPDN